MMELTHKASPLYFKVLGSLVFILLFQQSDGKIQLAKFFRNTLCSLSVRLKNGCSTQVPKVRSSIECLLSCSKENSCIGASFNKGVCLNHKTCTSVKPCAVDNRVPFYVFGRCGDGAEWIAATSQCKCTNGMVGTLCDERPIHCDGLVANGYPRGMEYASVLDLDNDGKNLVPVVCWIPAGIVAPSLQLLRNPGSNEPKYNMTWAQYRDGFLDTNTRTWLTGLKSLHLLTEAGYRILTINVDISGMGAHFATYKGFRVSDEASGFSFTFDKYSAGFRNGYKVGDCLGPYQNTPFSTWDRDNDGVGNENCASRAGAGWWYNGNGCNNPCNIFGLDVGLFDSKPSYQVVSLLGYDMNKLKNKNVRTRMHLRQK